MVLHRPFEPTSEIVRNIRKHEILSGWFSSWNHHINDFFFGEKSLGVVCSNILHIERETQMYVPRNYKSLISKTKCQTTLSSRLANFWSEAIYNDSRRCALHLFASEASLFLGGFGSNRGGISSLFGFAPLQSGIIGIDSDGNESECGENSRYPKSLGICGLFVAFSD